MPADWSFEQDAAGRGVVRHNALPRFTALWTSGTAEGEPRRLNPVGADAGSGDDDRLHLFGFQWRDPLLPDAESFERLMQEAAKFIDAWIENRL
jgi:hypothetical protein